MIDTYVFIFLTIALSLKLVTDLPTSVKQCSNTSIWNVTLFYLVTFNFTNENLVCVMIALLTYTVKEFNIYTDVCVECIC